MIATDVCTPSWMVACSTIIVALEGVLMPMPLVFKAIQIHFEFKDGNVVRFYYGGGCTLLPDMTLPGESCSDLQNHLTLKQVRLLLV